MPLVDFARTVKPRPRCDFCKQPQRESRGAFLRQGRSTLHACHKHYTNGMIALIHHVMRSRGGGG